MDKNTVPALSRPAADKEPGRMRLFFKKLGQQRALAVMSVPFLIWLFVFKYLPLWGWSIAFQDYKPARKFMEQTWIGFEHFKFLFGDDRFLRVLRNTLAMSSINLFFGFVTAITLALLLNEIRNIAFKRVVQTVSYLPHFISWVVAASIIQTTLSPDGTINQLLVGLGFLDAAMKSCSWVSRNTSGPSSEPAPSGRISAGTPSSTWPL